MAQNRNYISPLRNENAKLTINAEVQTEIEVNLENPKPEIEEEINIGICSPQEQHGILIPGKVNDSYVTFLVDTGAAVSIVNSKFISSADIDSSVSRKIVSASGNEIEIIGCAKAKMLVAGESDICQVYVAKNFPYQCLVGVDILKSLGVLVDFETDTVIWKNVPIQMLKETDIRIKQKVLSVCLIKTQEIPARSEAIITGKIKSAPIGMTGIIEPKPDFNSRYNIMAARTLTSVNADNHVTVRLLNPTSSPVKLYKNSVVGTLEEIDSVIEQNDQNEIKNADVSNLKTGKLTGTEHSQLMDLINEFSDVFAKDDKELGQTNLVEHTINTEGAMPIKQRPYRVPVSQRTVVQSHIDDMLARKVIRPSKSPWSSPIVLVKKKNGQDRFCVDYRALNSVTKRDVYPLPRIDDMLDTFHNAKYFSTLDLMSGYWQVPVAENDKEKTAMVTSSGLFEWNVMPFGLCNSPSTFQRLMDVLLSGLQDNVCLVYIDDIIVFSSSFDDHLSRLRTVFSRLRQANLKLKPQKCDFCMSEVSFLGHIVSSDGVKPDPSKVSAVKDYPRPSNVTELRSFLGLVSYYRKFIPDFAKKSNPLTNLLKKQQPFNWDDNVENAFVLLKDSLVKSPILCYPDFTKPFTLLCDASGIGLGIVLTQVTDSGERTIAYASRQLRKHEKNYAVIELEALAIVWGVKTFRHYLYGNRFTAISDHNPLRWLMGLKQPTGRLARWVLALQEYDIDIQYRPGSKHGNADGLSRTPSNDQTVTVASTTTLDSIKPGLQSEMIREHQRKDPSLKPLISYLQNGNLPDDALMCRKIVASAPDYELTDGILYHYWCPGSRRKRQHIRKQLVVPRSLIDEIVYWCHDDTTAGHLSMNKTYHKIQERFFWIGMYSDVDHWCRSCTDCATKKTPKGRKKAPILPIPVDGPFDRVAIDVLGPFPPSYNGNRYIIVFSDYLTRWPEAKAVKNADGVTTAKFLVEDIIARHGSPRVLLTDRGSNFMSKVVKEVCKIMNTSRVHTTAYHPQTDGLVERFNATLATMLSMFVSSHQKDWDEFIPYVLFAYRTSIQESTQETPFYLLYGRDARLPVDVALSTPTRHYTSVDDYKTEMLDKLQHAFTLAKENTQLAQQKQKLYSDNKSKEPLFKIGEKVWLYTPTAVKGLSSKLLHPWSGPFRVIAKTSPVNFKLQSCDDRQATQIVHANRMKMFIDPECDLHPIASEEFELDESDSEALCNIGESQNNVSDSDNNSAVPCEILDKMWTRNNDNRLEAKYFVKWSGLSPDHNSWVSDDQIDPELLQTFESNFRKRTNKK